MPTEFPPMPADFEPTRATLHQYSHAIAVVPRAVAVPHDRWWHVSLNVGELGLETDPMSLDDGRTMVLALDVPNHDVVVAVDGASHARFSMAEGLTGTELAERVHEVVELLGIDEDYDADRYESDEPREYDAEAASAFWTILRLAYEALSEHRAGLGNSVGPVQLWPHGFDIAFEWFGAKAVPYEEDGAAEMIPSQCNFGFYPGGEAYFYANPWPFAAADLLGIDLPHGAEWHTDGWEGSKLPLSLLAGLPDGYERLKDYYMAVFCAAEPTLQQ